MTLPSHANILTGLYPYEHGVRDNEGFRLDPKFPTLATMLADKGYATAAVIGAFPSTRVSASSAGFRLYDQKYPQGAHAYDFSRGGAAGARGRRGGARSGILETPEHRRLLWVHLYDCHAPHVPPRGARPGLRRGSLSRTKSRSRRGARSALLGHPVSGKPTLVVVTSDHGEALGDHGEETHGLFAYEATLHVP